MDRSIKTIRISCRADGRSRHWHNQHAIKVNGKQSNITDEDLLVVADRFAIGTAKKVLAQVKAAEFESKAN